MGQKTKQNDKRLGNQFWKARAKHGRDKIFETPELLWEAAGEYFDWCDKNPLIKEIIQGGKRWEVSKMRAFTESGLCLFLNCKRQTFNNYGSNENYKDFFAVTSKIKQVIWTQKYEGAACGFFKAQIIARDLGLRDKSEIDVKDNRQQENERRAQELLDMAMRNINKQKKEIS